MLIIANGAFKSGSTWLFNILLYLTNFSPPPEQYLNKQWTNPSIHPNKLLVCLNELDYSNNNYLVKNHFSLPHERDIILSKDHIRVINIKRDIRDVVVSSFYHYSPSTRYKNQFNIYYWKRGRWVADRVQKYHLVWDVDSSKVFTSSYEKLIEDFGLEVKKIGDFLGFHLSAADLEMINNQTTLDKLRNKYKESNEKTYFRKGIVGDWRNHFNSKMLADLRNIQIRGIPPHEKFLKKLKIQLFNLFIRQNS